MAKYTTELRTICESLAGYDERSGFNKVDDVLSKSRNKIFSFEFPIFDEAYRSVLENKILKHYYTREIAAETFGLWQMWLDARLNEIMPYYNKLYESELLEFNPFYDVDYTKTGNREGDNTGTVDDDGTKRGTGTITTDLDGTTTRTNNLTETTNMANVPKTETWEEFSDTPQGALTGVRNMNYLTTARHITEDGTGSSTTGTVANTGTVTDVVDSTGTETRNTTDTEERTKTYNLNNTEEYLEHIVGKMSGSSYSKLLEEYRKTLLNIDMLIIRDLRDLFFGLW